MTKRKSMNPPSTCETTPTPLPCTEDSISSPHSVSSDTVEKIQPSLAQETQNNKGGSSRASKSHKGKPPSSKDSTRSFVWKHFDRPAILPGSTSPRAKCKYCTTSYKASSIQHGTTNMRRHLEKCKNFPGRTGPMDNYTISHDGQKQMVTHHFNNTTSRELLIDWLVCEELPFLLVESSRFRKFVASLEPQFDVPGRMTVARDMFKSYDVERKKLKDALRGLNGRVSLTTDTWTSSNNNSYMCITAHFIDNSWKLHKRIISFTMIEDHRGESIGKILESVQKEWGIEKLMCITVDNASVNNVAVDWIKKFGSNHLLEGQYIHVRCFAHILNLIVRYGLQKCDLSVERIRCAVKYVKSSPKRNHKFLECVAAVGIQCMRGVRLDVPTRWNSVYLMLDAAEKYEKAFDRLYLEDSGFRNCFDATSFGVSHADWENARKLIPFLKPFYDATNFVSGSSYVTINHYFGWFQKIQELLTNAIGNQMSLVHDTALEMKVKYDEYFSNTGRVNMLVYIALVLDPRSKLVVLQRVMKRAFESIDTHNRLYKDTEELLRKLYDMYNVDLGATTHEPSSTRVPGVETSMEDLSYTGVWDEERDASEFLCVNSKSELEWYLGEPLENPTQDFDVLGWWQRHEGRFHILCNVARDVFAIPASTVASESAFSTGGRVVTKKRSSLLPKTVEALLCLQSWKNNVNVIDSEELDQLVMDEETVNMLETVAMEVLNNAHPTPSAISSQASIVESSTFDAIAN